MRGPLALLTGLVLGILLADRLGAGPGTVALAAGVMLALLRAVLRLDGRRTALLVLLVAVLLGCALEQRALDGWIHSPLAAALARHGRRGAPR